MTFFGAKAHKTVIGNERWFRKGAPFLGKRFTVKKTVNRHAAVIEILSRAGKRATRAGNAELADADRRLQGKLTECRPRRTARRWDKCTASADTDSCKRLLSFNLRVTNPAIKRIQENPMRQSNKRRRSRLGKKRNDGEKQRAEYNGTVRPHEDDQRDEDFYDLDSPPPPSRNTILQDHLEKSISRLFVNNGLKDFREEQESLCELIVCAVALSRLNNRDLTLASRHPFQGKLKFRREGITNFTSIFRFVCDVECLLRESYGDVEGDDLDELLPAIWTIVMEFTKCVCPDVYREYRDAYEYEYDQSWVAAPALTNRDMQVNVNPGAYCWYSKKFVKSLEKYWPELISWIPGRPHR
jgi:hypothetical protein